MKNELDIVRDVSRALLDLDVAFMLTGSMALNYYAEPRMTRDIDIVLALAEGKVESIVDAFATDYYVSKSSIQRAITHQTMFNMIHQESVIKVDCIVQKKGRYRETELARRRRVQIADFETYVVSKEDLILSKLIWAKDSRSELQLGDVRNLLATQCDQKYLDQWASELRVESLLEECRHG